jgi:hypothetical protein
MARHLISRGAAALPYEMTRRREDEMADTAKPESPDAETMRRLAAARGLGRAQALFPDTVAAAFARGSQATSTAGTIPPLTELAVTFDPAAFKVTE